MYNTSVKQGFSIIEILIGMFIFSLGIISVYALISSSLRINEYNKNYIIAVNLAREQVELLHNNRDYNYSKIQKFDQINNTNPLDYTDVIKSGYYKIENNFDATASFPITITEIPSVEFSDDSNYQLCFDEENSLYVYCEPTSDFKKIHFFKYIEVEKNIENDQLLIHSVVKWKIKGDHTFEVKTILADWKQL